MIVIVPHHNEPMTVLEATVESALALDCCEGVVVVDDASAEPPDVDVWEISELRFSYVKLAENRGPAGAINAGIRHLEHFITGDPLVARLDCGDLLTEGRGVQVGLMLDHGLEATFSPYFDPTKGAVIQPHRPWETGVFTDNMFAASTTVYRRSVWERVGGYDESLRWCDDWDFAMKVQRAIGWEKVDIVTTHAAQFPGGHSDVAGEAAARRSAERKVVHGRGLRLKRGGR